MYQKCGPATVKDRWPRLDSLVATATDSRPRHHDLKTRQDLFVCASVIKQLHLVPAEGRSHCVDGKITVVLVSHWSCTTDLMAYSPSSLIS